MPACPLVRRYIMNEKITIEKIHNEFVPAYDRWQGKLLPRIAAWFCHISEIIVLLTRGSKPYQKHGKTVGSCREHAKTEFGDWLWLTAEIIWMVTRIGLPIVPVVTFQRLWKKMEESKVGQ